MALPDTMEVDGEEILEWEGRLRQIAQDLEDRGNLNEARLMWFCASLCYDKARELLDKDKDKKIYKV